MTYINQQAQQRLRRTKRREETQQQLEPGRQRRKRQISPSVGHKNTTAAGRNKNTRLNTSPSLEHLRHARTTAGKIGGWRGQEGGRKAFDGIRTARWQGFKTEAPVCSKVYLASYIYLYSLRTSNHLTTYRPSLAPPSANLPPPPYQM